MAKQKRKAKAKRSRKQGRQWLVWGGAAALAALVVFAGYLMLRGDDAPPKRPVRVDPVYTTDMDVTVAVIDNDFEPRELVAPVGATITWSFDGDLPHNVTEDRGAWKSDTLRPGDTWTMTFDAPGTYYYYCTLHHIMQGTLTISEDPRPPA